MEVIKFQGRMNAREAEAQIVEAIKSELYKYTGLITVAQAIGCLEIVKQEITQEQ